MAPKSNFYGAQYDDIKLWISRFDGDKSRTKVIIDPIDGDEHTVLDRGRVVFKSNCTLLFDYMEGDDVSPLDRLQEFKAKVDSAKSYVLTHPVEGSFMASVGNCRYTCDESGNLGAEVEFIADGVVADAIPAGSSSVPVSGIGAVDSAAEKYTAEMAEIGVPDGNVGADAKVVVDSWNAEAQVSPGQISVGVGSLTDRIKNQASALTSDLNTWEAFKSNVALGEQIYQSAKAAKNGDLTSFVIRLGTDTNLRALLASEFGADKVDGYYQRVLDMNDMYTPGILTRGTAVHLPQEKAPGRNG